MQADFINPFVDAVYNLCTKMLAVRAVRSALTVSDGPKHPSEVMGLIGFSGVVRGTVALAMPRTTSDAMARRLLNTDCVSDDATVSDSVAEMVNIVAGQAKAQLSLKLKQTLELSLPVVLSGQEYEVYSPSRALWLEIPFETDLGPLTVRLSFQSTGAAAS